MKFTATATAAGIGITIGSMGNFFSTFNDTHEVYLDQEQGTEQYKGGLTGWVQGEEKIIPWSEFSPSGLYGRSSGATIEVRLINTTNVAEVSATTVITLSLEGGGGGGAPCFVASSKLLTLKGYCAAADIKTGDLLMTADGRPVPVKAYSFTVEKANKETAPFLLPKDSISAGCPKTDLCLSPWHAFQVKKGIWMKPMSALELGYPVTQYDLGKSVTYYHFEAPDYFKDNFICEGSVVESFGGAQAKDLKNIYTYSASLKGYTRIAANPKQNPKTITM